MKNSERVHATAVQFCGKGLLMMGASGSGKSDLALRLIDAGGRLIADDQVLLENQKGKLMARCPDTIKGMIELRGFGIVRMPNMDAAKMDYAVICESQEVPRMPEAEKVLLCGIALPLLKIRPFEASAVAKLRAILQNPQVE